MQTLEAKPQPALLSLDDKIERICRDLAGLDPGPLAELRRMDATSEQYGAPYFWRLCSRYDLARGPANEQTWAQVIQALAILTPKGRDEGKPSRHARRVTKPAPRETPTGRGEAPPTVPAPRHGLGRVLCDGADRGWPADPTNPKPVYSEARLAQLLGSTGETRIDLVLRMTRLLAARLSLGDAFDCTDIARLLLYPEDPAVGRRIARDYYARLDGARRTEADDNDSTDSPGDET